MEDIVLSVEDRAAIAGQMTVVNYLKRQVEQLEKEIVVMVMMSYGVDLRKQGTELDLENGLVRNVAGPSTN